MPHFAFYFCFLRAGVHSDNVVMHSIDFSRLWAPPAPLLFRFTEFTIFSPMISSGGVVPLGRHRKFSVKRGGSLTPRFFFLLITSYLIIPLESCSIILTYDVSGYMIQILMDYSRPNKVCLDTSRP